jgi:hypothetical protein
MDQHHDHYFASDDHDVFFEQTQGFFEEVQQMTTALTGNQADAYEEFLTSGSTELIFGSNLIENAGLGHEITIRICKAIFADAQPISGCQNSRRNTGFQCTIARGTFRD